MNHAPPPTRDVPPRSRARIRARLEDEVTGGRRAVRFAPLITAGVAVAAVVALVAVVTPRQQGGDDVAVGPTVVPTTTSSAPAATPVVAGLAPERIAEIEQGCADSAGVRSEPVLHQYLTDEIGTFALLYSEHDVLSCTVDGPTMPYNSAMASGLRTGWLPGEFAADEMSSASGGDGGKPEYAGRPGYDQAVGRVTSKVARVTFGRNGQEVDATIANGTFVARIAHPSDWRVPAGWEQYGYVRAFDAQGALLGEWGAGWDRTKCWVDPDGRIVVGARDRDPATCAPAVAWE
ncbi:hypothetical protein FHX81_5420 [Saccharothrix saharensis]|uniref:Uncharacterized protein n=1 Tax=Saccharothrix saharensis TaxID=571190 RepID=A0A543JJG5_9PSEU|nr:hypothetical protein [Saccharothrix saharensis]TQM83007.1 hypothetical protein FHX81_5420 [Saccharothrix saharensis]